jgi:hypothetical protein
MRHYRVPPAITGPFATRIDGLWHSHRTPTGAWTLAWPSRWLESTLVLARSGDGWEPVPRPAKRPGAVSGSSGASGQHVTRRAYVPVGDGWEEAAAEDGVSLATWIAGAAAQRFRRRNPAR